LLNPLQGTGELLNPLQGTGELLNPLQATGELLNPLQGTGELLNPPPPTNLTIFSSTFTEKLSHNHVTTISIEMCFALVYLGHRKLERGLAEVT